MNAFQMPFALGFGLFILVIIALAICGALAARKRREGLLALASRLGLSFSPAKDYELARRFEFLNRLRQGDNRYAYNLISGSYQGHEVCLFDYHYETHSTDSKGHRQTHHHHFSFFVLTLPVPLPEVRIYKEGFGSKLAQAFGYEDIDFESAEFSREFVVRSPDKRAAYDVCNPQMIEYLLANRDLNIEIEGRALSLGFARCLSLEQIEPNLERLLSVRSLLPEYLLNRG